jgi:two-component system sensor histidine kinase BaeS
MTSSLGRRLGLGFAAIALAAALLTGLLVNLSFNGRFDSYLDQQRGARVQQLAAAVTAVYESEGRWDADRLEELGPALAMAGADVVLNGPGGDVIWPRENSRTAEMAAMHRAMAATGPLTEPVTVPITIDGRVRGSLTVALPEGTVPLADQQLRTSVNRLLLAGGAGVAVLASVLGMVLARRVTRPVAELTAAAHDLRAGDRTRRAAVSGRDEVAQLARAFNDLAASAEREEALRQSFTADVAHELRTPVSILRSQLEAVHDGVLELTPALASSLHDEILRLGRLIADLETLTGAEAGSFSLQRVPVDLSDIAGSVVAGFRHRFQERGLELDLQLTAATVEGDPSRLGQVLANLLGNAMKFVPAGGRVSVTTQTHGGMALLEVRDDGPGIPEAEIPRVFDRYYRGSGARANGSGIGLSVVAALVEAHGGKVEAGNAIGGGAVLTVTLPTSETGATVPLAEATGSVPPAALSRE